MSIHPFQPPTASHFHTAPTSSISGPRIYVNPGTVPVKDGLVRSSGFRGKAATGAANAANYEVKLAALLPCVVR